MVYIILPFCLPTTFNFLRTWEEPPGHRYSNYHHGFIRFHFGILKDRHRPSFFFSVYSLHNLQVSLIPCAKLNGMSFYATITWRVNETTHSIVSQSSLPFRYRTMSIPKGDFYRGCGCYIRHYFTGVVEDCNKPTCAKSKAHMHKTAKGCFCTQVIHCTKAVFADTDPYYRNTMRKDEYKIIFNPSVRIV